MLYVNVFCGVLSLFAAGPEGALRLAGLIALSDPPRTDSAALISELRTMGVRTVMLTGDAPTTARIVAHAVGIEGVFALLQCLHRRTMCRRFPHVPSRLMAGRTQGGFHP